MQSLNLVLLFLSFLTDQTLVKWHFADTEIFDPLRVSDVRLAGDEHIFVLSFNQAQILHFKTDGSLTNIIGRKGEGPGEFAYPTMFFTDREHLYVFDAANGKMSTFNFHGEFVSWTFLRRPALSIHRVANGWITVEPSRRGLDSGAPEVFWSNNQFEAAVKICSYKSKGMMAGLATSDQNGIKRAEYSPIDVKPLVLVDNQGETVYITHPEKLQIDIYDVLRLEKTGQIDYQHQRLPFDDDWAKRKLKTIKAEKNELKGVSVELIIPEFFPAIRSISRDPDGHLLLSLWRGNPDATLYLLTLDLQGKKHPTRFTPFMLERVVGTIGSDLIGTTFVSAKGEAGLARFPKSELKRFLEVYPIATDEEGGGRKVHIKN